MQLQKLTPTDEQETRPGGRAGKYPKWWHGTESVGQRKWWPCVRTDTMKTDNDDDDDDDITFVLNVNK